MIEAIRFSTYLEALALEIKKPRSGEKSTLKLMAAGARLLEDVGYRELNIKQICSEAKLAKGSFYVYFESKEVFLNQLIARYVGFEVQTHPSSDAQVTPYRWIRDFVAWYDRTFAANVGILRCLIELSAVSTKHLALWHRRNLSVVDKVISHIARKLDIEPLSERYKLLGITVRTAGGMVDQSLFERYNINVGVGKDNADLEVTIELLALLCYRAIYGENPPPNEVEHVRAFLSLPSPANMKAQPLSQKKIHS